MLSRKLLRILACPVCRGELRLKGGKLVCRKCSQEYPIVDGIPYLLPPELMPARARPRR